VENFQQAHCQWVAEALSGATAVRDDRWSKAIAVGNLMFVEKMNRELGFKARYREVAEVGGTYTLRDQREAYAGD
jgi:putative transposase